MPSQRRVEREGSRISAAHLPQGRCGRGQRQQGEGRKGEQRRKGLRGRGRGAATRRPAGDRQGQAGCRQASPQAAELPISPGRTNDF